jgi:hypothetical protein
MNIFTASPTTLSTLVWSQANRGLTSFVPPLNFLNAGNNSIAANTTVGFNPSSFHVRCFTFGLKAGAAGTLVALIDDGTNQYPITTVVAGTLGSMPFSICGDQVFIKLKNNDAVNAGTYAYIIVDIS